MAIDIEAPGGNLTALRQALGKLVGRTLIDQNMIVAADNATHLTFGLPTGYKSFELKLDAVQMPSPINGTYNLGYAFSPDGGVTWYNDPIVEDTYQTTIHAWMPGLNNPNVYNAGLGTIFGQAISDGADVPNAGAWSNSIINPGDDDTFPTVYTESYWSAGAADTIYSARAYSRLRGHHGRVNAMMILPLGNDDAPPTSNIKITNMCWTLWGIPD